MESSQQFRERLKKIRSRQKKILLSAVPHPLLTEVEQRIKRLTSILSLNNISVRGGYDGQLIERAPMQANMIEFEISRCEFIIDQFESRQLIQPSSYASSLVHPTLRVVFVQKLIQGILFFKNFLFNAKEKYRSWNIWHLVYLRNNMRISGIIQRILFKFFGWNSH
jgi:hypothetical protein